MQPSLVFVKLGGSLITDKSGERAARRGRIQRLSREIAEVAAGRRGGLVIGHGSGSFGHATADRHGWLGGPVTAQNLGGVVATQGAAAELHRLVLDALLGAGVPAYSLVPSSFIVADGGHPEVVSVEPLTLALGLGLVPVVYGDVVMDRENGAAICSTEQIFEVLARELKRSGRRIERVVWLGETAGVYDTQGQTIPRLAPDDAKYALSLEGSAGTDVTGGIRLRVRTALSLAAEGIPSLICDGRREGALERAVSDKAVEGTVVEEDPE